MNKNRARLEILSDLFSSIIYNSRYWAVGTTKNDLHIGDLVSLSCAGPSKWYLSWLRDMDMRNGRRYYLLESIEDGETCWWGNVGLNVYSRKRVEESPRWQWGDEQFAFDDRWMEVCRENDAYIVLPRQPVFNPDGSVLMDVRIRFSLHEYNNPKTFLNWKEVTAEDLDSYYKECCVDYEEKLAAGQLPLPSL